ncbi:MAG TPA: hypothetical protein VIB07_07915 [Nitrososphaera sp.]|jgi:hypothetical protein
MNDPEALLKGLNALLHDSFKNAIVWEQRDADIIGNYVYIKFEGRELGMFMGYVIGQSGAIRGCITFLFAHPNSGAEEKSHKARLFHRLLIKFNLRMSANRYKIVSGKSPAIIRMKYFPNDNFGADMSEAFFKESINVMKACEPLYKSVPS